MKAAMAASMSAGRSRNRPLPVQPRLPILIGGMGDRVALRLVARFDMNNLGSGDIERVRARDSVLVSRCEAMGRDPAELAQFGTPPQSGPLTASPGT